MTQDSNHTPAPAHAIVLIAQIADRYQTDFMEGLGYLLHEQGFWVFILSVG